MFWIVVAAVVVALLAGAWLVDHHYRMKRFDRRRTDLENMRGRISAQVQQDSFRSWDGL